ncbi:MAG: ABC transporter permease [Chloroflexi bacterium AL-W]|nr:ABC transporter permease [Chloroflexi bacterium AL-W]
MNTHWRKIFRDLREYATQTALVGTAIMISTVAIMTALGAQNILYREVDASFESGHPASVIFWLDRVDDALVARVQQQPGITDAEARRLVRARAEIAPGDWRTVLIFGVRDFNNLRVSTFRSESGAWPPQDHTALVERSALSVLQIDAGNTLRIRAPGGTTTDLAISGTVHDPGMPPGWQDNVGYLYVTSATLAQLGQGTHLDELRITVAGDRAAATHVAADLSSWLTAQGLEVPRTEVPVREHPHADHMETLLLLLQVFSLLAFLLSGTLVAMMMSGLLARHVRQIGIIKAIGATSKQIAGMYLGFVLIIAVGAVIVGIPIGTLIARAFATLTMEQLNLEVSSWAIAGWVFGLVALLGVGCPLLIALGPVFSAVRMSAHEAIQQPGIQPPTKRLSVNLVLLRFPIDRTVTLALRNTFRRPIRLTLTLSALALGGTMLMTAINVYQGLITAVNTSLDARGDDIDVRLLGLVPTDAITNQVREVPGVQLVEAWGHVLAQIELPGEPSEPNEQHIGTGRYALFAPPVNTHLLRLPITEGRWPEPDEQGAVVVSRNLQADEPGLQLGADIALVVSGQPTQVQIVGVLEDVTPASMYTNPLTLEAVTGQAGSTGALRIVTNTTDDAHVATAVEETLIDAGWFPSFLMTRSVFRDSMIDHFLILLFLLSAVAVASVIVSGLGLATSMSLNVLERRREIGVTRAIGGSNRTVLRILLLEGAAITVSSVLLAIVLSVPLSAIVSFLVGNHGLYVAVPLIISPFAIGGWVIVAIIVTALAIVWPAQSMIRIPVHNTLTYE